MDLRTPCLLCYWRACSCGREQRAADRQWLDRMAERNERAARIAQLRKAPRIPREREVTIPLWMLALLALDVAALALLFAWLR